MRFKDKMSGPGMHIEKAHREENDPKRHKARCIHYEDKECNLGGPCYGSAHCKFYRELNVTHMPVKKPITITKELLSLSKNENKIRKKFTFIVIEISNITYIAMKNSIENKGYYKFNCFAKDYKTKMDINVNDISQIYIKCNNELICIANKNNGCDFEISKLDDTLTISFTFNKFINSTLSKKKNAYRKIGSAHNILYGDIKIMQKRK